MQQTLKQFNKTITIDLQVDFIAQAIYGLMDKSNPHAALLTNQIVGCAMEDGRLGQLFSAASGFSKEINVTVGKTYTVQNKHLEAYRAKDGWRELSTTVVVEEVSEYRRNNPISVKYTYTDRNDTETSTTGWIEPEQLQEWIAVVPASTEVVA